MSEIPREQIVVRAEDESSDSDIFKVQDITFEGIDRLPPATREEIMRVIEDEDIGNVVKKINEALITPNPDQLIVSIVQLEEFDKELQERYGVRINFDTINNNPKVERLIRMREDRMSQLSEDQIKQFEKGSQERLNRIAETKGVFEVKFAERLMEHFTKGPFFEKHPHLKRAAQVVIVASLLPFVADSFRGWADVPEDLPDTTPHKKERDDTYRYLSARGVKDRIQ